MPGDVMHLNTGAQDAPASGDHMVQARVADQDPVDRPGVLEVGFRPAEAPAVLIDVEEQYYAAVPPSRRTPQPGGDVGEDGGSRLGVR